MKEKNKTIDVAGRAFSFYCHLGSAVLQGYNYMSKRRILSASTPALLFMVATDKRTDV